MWLLQCWAEQTAQKTTAILRHLQPALQGNGKKSLVADEFRDHLGYRTGIA
jgi:hypothetical protein